MRQLLNAFGGPGCIVVTLAILATVPTILGFVILRPISRAAGRMKTPTRFLLSDFFWLVIQFQMVLGYCVRFIGIEHLDYFLLIGSFLFLAAVSLWAGAVSIMSRAGVVIPAHRAVFILFLLPATLGLMMGTSFAVLLGAILKFDFASEEFKRGLEIMAARTHVGFWEIMVGLSLLPAMCYVLRRTAFWILAGSQLHGATDATREPSSAAPDVSSQGIA
jgi:hypothetical protein